MSRRFHICMSPSPFLGGGAINNRYRAAAEAHFKEKTSVPIVPLQSGPPGETPIVETDPWHY